MEILRFFVPIVCTGMLFTTACTNSSVSQQTKEGEKPVLVVDFADSQVSGWRESEVQSGDTTDSISDYANGQHRLLGRRILKSPAFSVNALQYYQLDMELATTHKMMWAWVFWNQDGEMLLADVYSSIDPGDDLAPHRFFVQAKADAVKAQLWLQGVDELAEARIRGVSIRRMDTVASYSKWADSVYAEMPQIQEIQVPSDRKQMMPNALGRLHAGKKLRVVMLGNSIINDTGNSGWELMVEGAYPGADMEVITSVRGGTGCWYYQEENRVDTFVLRYEPDLLIIGGISHRKDTAAIHNVIRQVRAKSNAEILVFSGPVGRQGDPRTDSTFTIPPEGDDFRLQLAAMARDAGVGYFDMKTEWGSYIRSSGKSYEYFLRDPVHANARGRQILARLMFAYFAS